MGVLLGTLGLAVVLLRNVWERRGELALLRALGYKRRELGWLVLAENALLVLMGLAVGLLAALVAVTPHLRDRFADLPWLGIAALVGLTLLFGLGSGLLALLTTLRTPLLPALRRE
jgi:ABC-type antimicrobial peptide transport system permease subunit